jgi:hypothetical protein
VVGRTTGDQSRWFRCIKEWHDCGFCKECVLISVLMCAEKTDGKKAKKKPNKKTHRRRELAMLRYHVSLLDQVQLSLLTSHHPSPSLDLFFPVFVIPSLMTHRKMNLNSSYLKSPLPTPLISPFLSFQTPFLSLSPW